MARSKRAVTALLRLQVAARDGIECQYCGATTADVYQVDHIIPFVLGGPCALHNLVMACQACNERKIDAVWVLRNLARIAADRPDWQAHVLLLAENPDEAELHRLSDGADPPMCEAIMLQAVGERVIDSTGIGLLPAKPPTAAYTWPSGPLWRCWGWAAQVLRLKRDLLLAEALRLVNITTPGGTQIALCLPLDMLPGWLFGLSAGRVRPELQAKITSYRRICFDLLAQAFRSDTRG